MKRIPRRSRLVAAAAVGALSLAGTLVPGRFESAFADPGRVESRPQLAYQLWVSRVASDSAPAIARALNPPASSATNADGCPLLIYEALGDAGCKIAFCESGWNPDAVGPGGTLGWFQVHPAFHPDATLDPAGNVAAAVRISSGGADWSAWGVASVLETGVCPGGVAYPGT